MSEIYYIALKPGVSLDELKKREIVILKSATHPNQYHEAMVILNKEQLESMSEICKEVELERHMLRLA